MFVAPKTGQSDKNPCKKIRKGANIASASGVFVEQRCTRVHRQKNMNDKLKNMTVSERTAYCEEIRQFLIASVSQTGGHLASNLGVVELTVALSTVFDTDYDRLIFDVGHQCYVHKLLTGRKDGFATLRQFEGMSGFMKPSESTADPCITGHASAAISVALGMARARTLRGEKRHIIAVVGDGALTGGMTYEALNDAGDSKEPLIVVLNDNNMSIDKNVGGLSRHLSNLRVSPRYLRAKARIRAVASHIWGGTAVVNGLSACKRVVKSMLISGSVFEQMGFTYLGPVDGHDLPELCALLTRAKAANRPVLLHVMTQKGKGYAPAEHSPDLYHGVSPFDPAVGIVAGQKNDFSAVFGQTLTALAEKDGRICAVTAAMPSGTGLSGFAAQFPNRFFDVGIAEEHAIAMTAGMTAQGIKPVCALYSTFLQRGYDQLLHDVAIAGIPAIFCIDRAGIVGADGETHNGCFDVPFLRTVPNMEILCPASYAELRTMLARTLYHGKRPTAIRYPRGGEGDYKGDVGTQLSTILHPVEQPQITIITYGTLVNTALQTAQALTAQGLPTQVVKLNQIGAHLQQNMPAVLDDLAGQRLLVLEDCVQEGSVGQAIAAYYAQQGIALPQLERCNVGQRFLPHGSPAAVMQYCGLDAESLVHRLTKEKQA